MFGHKELSGELIGNIIDLGGKVNLYFKGESIVVELVIKNNTCKQHVDYTQNGIQKNI